MIFKDKKKSSFFEHRNELREFELFFSYTKHFRLFHYGCARSTIVNHLIIFFRFAAPRKHTQIRSLLITAQIISQLFFW